MKRINVELKRFLDKNGVVMEKVYTCGPTLFGDKIQINTHYVHEANLSTFSYGDSKKKGSCTSSIPLGCGHSLDYIHTTPEAAFEHYKAISIRAYKARLRDLETQIRLTNKDLASMERAQFKDTVKVEYDPDYEPCCW